MKVLLWLVFFGLVIAALFTKLKSVKSRATRHQREATTENSGAEFMLRCGHCGVHFPSSDAFYHAGTPYCCEDHCGKPASS